MIRWLVLLAVVTAVGVLGLQELADATRNEDDPHRAGTRSEIVLDVRTRRSDPDLAAQGLWATCHLTVPFAEVVEPLARTGDRRDDRAGDDDEGRYAVVVTPALGENDRRRLRGCLQDGTVDRAWADVVSISPTSPSDDAG